MDDKHLYWKIPSSVNLEGFLKNHPPKFKYKIDHFYSIIEYLCIGMEMDDLDSNAGFINASSKILQKANHNYKKYLNHLVDFDFITSDEKYIVGQKCKGYLIKGLAFKKATIKSIKIENSVIRRNRSKTFKKFNNRIKNTEKVYPHLTKWFNDSLVIDFEAASDKVKELYPIKSTGIRGKHKKKAFDWQKRFKAIYSIQKFANQDFYYVVDDNVGRFHSNLTNIKSELRNFITYDGRKLVNVDIKNSQPLLSTLLFNKDFYSEKGQIINIYNIPSSIKFLSNNYHSFSATLIMLVETLQLSDSERVNEYIAMVNSGEFYKEISDLLFPNMAFNKKSMKQLIFTIFFSSNRFIGQPEAKDKKVFSKILPDIYNVFKSIKMRDYKSLAHILQRIESIIIIENVVKRISDEKPDLPIFTIHDSVAATIGNEEYVASIIQKEVLKLTGLKVRLGMEYWDY